MKHMRKLASLLLALVMVFAMATTAFADGDEDGSTAPAPTGSITITNANEGQTYTFYQLFEAIPGEGNTVSYKPLIEDFPENDYFKVENGYIIVQDAAKENEESTVVLSEDAINWLTEKYLTIGREIKEVNATDTTLTVDGLPYGYYYITTTTGTIVSIDTTTSAADVEDKNPTTTVDKTITGVADGSVDADGEEALAQIGTTVSYESRIPIQNGAYNYKFTDVMTDGLTLNPSSVKVYIVETDAAVAENATAETNFGTLTAANSTDDAVADITIAFSDTWLKANVGKDIVIQYSATINENAVIGAEGNPNTAKIEYGNEDYPLTDTDEAKVYSAQITVTKQDGNSQPLEGAGFVISKTVTEKNDEDEDVITTLYYKWNAATEDAPAHVTWVENIDNATEHTSGSDGKVDPFIGLADGTYTLIEKTVPDGYNKAADQTFTIDAGNYTNDNLIKSATVVNQAGSELPSTGGMGTTLFYIFGGIMVLAAVVLLVTKKRMSAAE